VVKSANRGEPLTFGDSAPAAHAFQRIASRILGETVPFPDFSEEQGKGFLAGIRKFFGRKE